MAEPEDAIVPILRSIQADLADVKRTQAEHSRILAGHSEKLEVIEDYTTYALGIQSQHGADISKLKRDIAEVKRRLRELEDAR